MGIVINPLELLALKKLAVICGALGKTLRISSAGKEQTALTSVLVEVINRAEIDNACGNASAKSIDASWGDR